MILMTDFENSCPTYRLSVVKLTYMMSFTTTVFLKFSPGKSRDSEFNTRAFFSDLLTVTTIVLFMYGVKLLMQFSPPMSPTKERVQLPWEFLGLRPAESHPIIIR